MPSFASAPRVRGPLHRSVSQSTQRAVSPMGGFTAGCLPSTKGSGGRISVARYSAFTDPLGKTGKGGDKPLQRCAARRGHLREERRLAIPAVSCILMIPTHCARDMLIFNQFRPRLKRASHRLSQRQRRIENRRGHHLVLIVCRAAKTNEVQHDALRQRRMPWT